MTIQNPFVKGTVPFQNFNSTVQSYQHQTTDAIQSVLDATQAKIDNWMNYNSYQIDGFEQTARALKAVIDSRS